MAYGRKAKADMRELQTMEIESLKKEYWMITRYAKLASDTLPKDAKELLESLAYPQDYKKIVQHLGTCSPKVRRIARHCLEAWNILDSRLFVKILKEAFFNGDGKLRSASLDGLFSEFHKTLLEEVRRVRRECRDSELWLKAADELGIDLKSR